MSRWCYHVVAEAKPLHGPPDVVVSAASPEVPSLSITQTPRRHLLTTKCPVKGTAVSIIFAAGWVRKTYYFLSQPRCQVFHARPELGLALLLQDDRSYCPGCRQGTFCSKDGDHSLVWREQGNISREALIRCMKSLLILL